MATFPTALPSYLGFTASHTLAADLHASQHNSEQADIVAIATKIGTGASTPVNQRLLRGNGTGTSAWAQADLITDVTGVLPIANGGNGTTATTGTGSAAFGTAPTISNPTITGGGSWAGSPTISTPTIADFTNAIHTHATNAQGGQLDFTALLSTIFSGQIQTYTNTGGGGGTGYFVNLGGIKLCWGLSNNVGATGSGNQSTSLPAGFFTTVLYGRLDIFNPNATPQYVMNALTTSLITIFNATSLTSFFLMWFVVGT